MFESVPYIHCVTFNTKNNLPETLDKQNGFLHNMLNKVQKQATSKGNNHLWLHHNISWKDSMHSRCYANLHIHQ